MNEGMQNLMEIETLKEDNHELKKMIDITREEAQIIQLQADKEIRNYKQELHQFTKRIVDLENVNKSHRELNGILRKENKQNRELLREAVKELADHKDLVKTYRKAGIL